MKIALVQMRSGTDVTENVREAGVMITRAAEGGAQFVATPEMTHLLQKDANALRKAIRKPEDDIGVATFAALAGELGIYLLIGSMAVLREDGQVANRSFLFGPEGTTLVTYDKIHLFEAAISKSENYREADTYTAGVEGVLVDVDAMTLGLSICYDVRFPTLYSSYAKGGADIIFVPAAFTCATGEAHWETLLRARAIETGAYIVAPAQGGAHADGRKTWGRSMVIGPWGEIIAKRDNDTPGLVFADIDIAKVQKARSRIPAWQGAAS